MYKRQVFEGDDDALNGTYPITVISPSAFTYEVPVAPVLTVGALNFIDGNHIQLTTAAPNVSVIPISTQGSGTHTIAINSLVNAGAQVTPIVTETRAGFGGFFPSQVRHDYDSQALADAINANFVTNKQYRAVTGIDEVTLTAREVGARWNTSPLFTGNSMRSTGITGGSEARNSRQPLLTPKPFYYADAPVMSLDGVSTRRYNAYSGSAVKFNTEPEGVQVPYMVSQVFPVEHHPLDSLAANQECSYPKGVFTQALAAHFTAFDLSIPESGTLTISVRGQPLQEQPSGVIDGVNTDFDMTLESCNGQNSMLVWVDGIFQPPTLWSYSIVGGHGRITMFNPPVSPQTIWVWYLIASDGCANEYVEELVGVVDGVNPTFSLVNGPVVDQPTILVFIQGLLSLQGVEYNVDVGNNSITYLAVPSASLNLWSHYNTGAIGTDKWLQLSVGTGNGTQAIWVLPTLLTSELPRSKDSVILALDGFVQREGVDFTVNTDISGAPDGFITFVTSPPAIGQVIQVAYLTRG